jgi:metal-sulfur cluster biosynthetic enzyme
MSLDAQVRDVLSRIHDPCSVAAGRPTSLIDMGMVLGWDLASDGLLTVRFAVTFAGCTMAPHFTQAAADDLARLPGVRRVETKVETDFVWTPERMVRPSVQMTGQPQSWRSRSI